MGENYMCIFIFAIIAFLIGVIYRLKKKLKQLSETNQRFVMYYDITNIWLKLKNHNIKLADYLKHNGYHKVAIYGIGKMGQRLYEELNNSPVEVSYFIDQKVDKFDNKDVVKIEDISKMEPVDAVIITPIYSYDVIENAILATGIDYPILSLEEVVYMSEYTGNQGD